MSRKQKRNLRRILIALVLFICVFVTDKIVNLATVIPSNLGWLLPLSLYFAIYVYIGYDVLRKAFLGIIHGQMLDENFLMGIATIGAFTLGIVQGVKFTMGTNPSGEIEGFDEACAVLLFYQVGEWFQSYAVGKSRKSISSLMDIRPDFANVYRDGKLETVSPEEVAIGDIIVVNPGEKVPLDGVVVKGDSTLDTKALTGESLPAEVQEGSEVLSGVVNLTKTIEIRVTKVFYDSTVAKILDLVENAQSQKSKAENFISKFAEVYTPIVVISALLLAILPPLFYGWCANNWSEWNTWIYRALSFLVVSCPCALVISIPLSFFAGIGAASKYGILVKGSNYLEKFNKANIFVFDKTGTLTKGNFAITSITPIENKEEILRYAAIAEGASSHPIAKSIVSMYEGKKEEGYTINNVAGSGIIANNGSTTIYCGNEKLMKDNGIEFIPSNEVGTLVYVAVDNKYLGVIVIADEIKPEAELMVKELSLMNAKTIMLTGDNEKIASGVASKLGLTDYKAGLLPQDKVSNVERLLAEKNEKDVLCFVGDGINDAPVLMRSDIGISMGGVGSDAAIEASDIVLMKDDLNGISLAKKIARKTMRIVLENITFALLVKVVILVLSAFGITNMWVAVFGDVGVAVICILNAMRVNSKYKEVEELEIKEV